MKAATRFPRKRPAIAEQEEAGPVASARRKLRSLRAGKQAFSLDQRQSFCLSASSMPLKAEYNVPDPLWNGGWPIFTPARARAMPVGCYEVDSGDPKLRFGLC